MKNFYLLCTTIIAMMLTYQVNAQVTVSGSGCSPAAACFGGGGMVDATYTQSSTDGTGRAVYNDPGNTLVIQFNAGTNQWEIKECGGAVYHTNSDPTTPNPPATGWSAGAGDCSASPAPTLSGNVVLPVQLVNFTSSILNKGIELQWATVSETNNKGFTIERSINRKDWIELGFVSGYGTTDYYKEYTYLDKSPSFNTNYYRLKQIDFDEAFEYSPIVEISLDKEDAELMVYPNPTHDYIQLPELKADAIVKVFNSQGKLLFQSELNGQQLSLKDLPKGVYWIQSEDKGLLRMGQIVKL